jgi:hypothetical protein
LRDGGRSVGGKTRGQGSGVGLSAQVWEVIGFLFDKTNPRELELRSLLAYAASFKCPVRIYCATQDHFVLTSQRTAELAKKRGLDVEAVRLVTPTAFDVGRHLIEGLKNPTVVRDTKAFEVCQIRPMGVKEAIQGAIASSTE